METHNEVVAKASSSGSRPFVLPLPPPPPQPRSGNEETADRTRRGRWYKHLPCPCRVQHVVEGSLYQQKALIAIWRHPADFLATAILRLHAAPGASIDSQTTTRCRPQSSPRNERRDRRLVFQPSSSIDRNWMTRSFQCSLTRCVCECEVISLHLELAASR